MKSFLSTILLVCIGIFAYGQPHLQHVPGQLDLTAGTNIHYCKANGDMRCSTWPSSSASAPIVHIFDGAGQIEEAMDFSPNLHANTQYWVVNSVFHDIFIDDEWAFIVNEYDANGVIFRNQVIDADNNVLLTVDTASYGCQIPMDEYGNRLDMIECRNQNTTWFYALPNSFLEPDTVYNFTYDTVTVYDTTVIVYDTTIYDTTVVYDTTTIVYDTTIYSHDTVWVYTSDTVWVADSSGVNGEMQINVNQRTGFASYPNPTNYDVSVNYKIPSDRTGALVIYDNTGQEIERRQLWSSFGTERIMVEDLSPGTYLISLFTEDGMIQTNKLVVNK